MPGSRALALLCAADLVVALDGMVVMVALPAIERDLGASQGELQWVVTAYTLTLGAFLLVGGRAGDLYGRRRMLVVGLVVFALASLAAGLASATAPLLAARAIQGIGAALGVPWALALLPAIYRHERERQRAIGRLSATIDVGMIGGLVVGGVLTASIGWPWCFFVAVPFGLAAAALAPSALEESRDEDAPPLDLAGATLAVAANAGGFVGMTFMATLYMQQVLGFSPLEAGLGSLPLALSAGAGGLAAPWIIDRAGARTTATVSLVVTALAFAYLARVPDDGGYATVLLPAFLIAGFTFATAFVPLTSQGMTGVREGEKGLASGLFQTSTHLGGAFVLTVLATAAAGRSAAALDAGETDAAALTSGFALAFAVAAAILALGAITANRTMPR